jgi:hypothetical protein
MARPAEHVTIFDRVHRDERDRLGLQAPITQLDGVGLALSGGGIRSASFALGVVQHFLNTGFLRRVDYLSTVSGGGYLGSAMSWWLHQVVTDPALKAASQEDLQREFIRQFGSQLIGARTAPAAGVPAPAVSSNSAAGAVSSAGAGAAPSGQPTQPQATAWGGAGWLAFIRQHGNYLKPPGIGVLSLVTSVLRVCFYSLFVYASAAVAFFSLLNALRSGPFDPYAYAGAAALVSVALLLLTSLVYGPATSLASVSLIKTSRLYEWRSRFRRVSGYILLVALATGLLWALPWLMAGITWLSPKIRWSSILSASGLGIAGTIYQFIVGRSNRNGSRALTQIRIVATAAIVIVLFLLGAYALADVSSDRALSVGIATALIAAVFGFAVNTNYSGLARLYRDRLMEAFLPDPSSVASNRWANATSADLQSIAGLDGRLDRNGDIGTVDRTLQCQRPLHLVNCNVVLVDSTHDIYRNRGGDSFCISSRWSGGDATGWIETAGLGDGELSLATAMSISGAAANPDSAPNGQGITRNRAVSFLMSLFNARLGYWLSNPCVPRVHPSNLPNLWVPGFRQGLLGRGLDENAAFLELTDGGHFDNTGAYELIRRRTKLVIVCEAGQDSDFSMGDIANLIEKVRVDFSVFVEFVDADFDLKALQPPKDQPGTTAARGFAFARIRYPRADAKDPAFDEGVLVYMQAVPVASMAADVASFWRRTAGFPNESTADQFFDEEHIEAYRELGYGIASSLSKEVKDFVHGSTTATPRKRAGTFDSLPLLPGVVALLQ